MLNKHAIREIPVSPETPGFYSPIFLVAKESGGWRPILNLKAFNKFVVPPSLVQIGIAINTFWISPTPSGMGMLSSTNSKQSWRQTLASSQYGSESGLSHEIANELGSRLFI